LPLLPRRAVVTPRARAVPDGEILPLHHQVQKLLKHRAMGVVNVFGPRGSGKTSALQHLAAVLPPDSGVLLIDECGTAKSMTRGVGRSLIIAASRDRWQGTHLAAFEMARWTDDDLIEYLLTRRKDRCASVMGRLKDESSRAGLGGAAELWAVVLEEMIEHDALATPAEALRHWLAARLGDAYFRRLVTDYCLKCATGAEPGETPDEEPPQFVAAVDPAVARLVAHDPVRLILASQRVVWDLAGGTGADHLHKPLPGDLVAEVAALAAFRAPVMDALRSLVQDRRHKPAHAAAATILHATKTDWRPGPGAGPDLHGAALSGAAWAGVDLKGANLDEVDLSRATLDGAILDEVSAASAHLPGASLREASLAGLRADHADLGGAVLSCARATGARFPAASLTDADMTGAVLAQAHFEGADLRRVTLRAANLRHSVLDDSNLDGADLCGADLSKAHLARVRLNLAGLTCATFREARIIECDLQGVEVTDAVFERASFLNSDLAGSILERADLRGAWFYGAGLADVRWEGADLRGADFKGASFHTGSSRSGLVNSVIASEGSRTGFYTDDYDDRDYKPPEEIRKACLCGADLRGAKVTDTDFYLVDLRHARYTSDQAAHFKRCGAIL
jgi:uncharacterized protein YjbI with pentapeptide repeats/energy-coupling factor transporter ATP-binding protein EcfA2